jgi:hypothetical protein
MRARIAAAIRSRIDRKKITSELRKAYLATTKPELQITTKIPGAKRSRIFIGAAELT